MSFFSLTDFSFSSDFQGREKKMVWGISRLYLCRRCKKSRFILFFFFFLSFLHLFFFNLLFFVHFFSLPREPNDEKNATFTGNDVKVISHNAIQSHNILGGRTLIELLNIHFCRKQIFLLRQQNHREITKCKAHGTANNILPASNFYFYMCLNTFVFHFSHE